MTNIDEIKARVKHVKGLPYIADSDMTWAAKTILELCGEIELVRNTYNIEKQELLNKIESAKIENLKKQVEDLKLELDEARDPVHCNLCGSCGVDMCCPAHGCAHPHIKSETLKEQSETILELYNELKEKDQVLEFVIKESGTSSNYNLKCREVLQKYKGEG